MYLNVISDFAEATHNFNFIASFHFASYMDRYNRIKVLLAEKQRTSKWLADEVGRSKATVSRWCSNQVQPPLEVLYQIANLLEVDVRELLVPNEYKK